MGQSKKPQLLVVEDDGLIRLDLVDMLEDTGFDVLDAANADDALSILEVAPHVTALLTDIDMPGSMNGLKLARVAYERWPDCKIVVISGRFDPDADALPPGAKFLTKPVSEKIIEKVLSEIGVKPD